MRFYNGDSRPERGGGRFLCPPFFFQPWRREALCQNVGKHSKFIAHMCNGINLTTPHADIAHAHNLDRCLCDQNTCAETPNCVSRHRNAGEIFFGYYGRCRSRWRVCRRFFARKDLPDLIPPSERPPPPPPLPTYIPLLQFLGGSPRHENLYYHIIYTLFTYWSEGIHTNITRAPILLEALRRCPH